MKLFGNLERKHYYLLAGWVVINILQSIFTELHADESYYWLYSKHLDWGFFDHPPMDACLIYLGGLISYSEWGARFFILILSSLTMALLMNELNEKKDLYFLSLFLLSFPLMHTHIAGFLALPDTPLVFFTLLFFLVYRKFAAKPSFKLSMLLALVAAAMVYSKYHAFLVLGFLVLSNLKLVKDKYFWTAIFMAIVLLLPHIIWQFDNQFPTFRYHLVERTKPLQFKYFIDNILSQVLVAGPLTGVVVLYALRKFRANNDPFKKAIIYNIVGFYAFLALMSFWNRIEAHYTVAVTPLLIIATYPVVSGNPTTKKWFKYLSLPMVVLFFILRFYMAANFIPNVGNLKLGFYNREATSLQIKELAHGKQVAFFNNFASPGMYEYYAKEKCLHLATLDYRFSQFDLWKDELASDNDSIFIVVPSRQDPTAKSVLKNGKKARYLCSPGFQSLKEMDLGLKTAEIQKDTLVIKAELTNNSKKFFLFDGPTWPSIGIAQHKMAIKTTPLAQLTSQPGLEPKGQILLTFKIPLHELDMDAMPVLFLETKEGNRGKMLPITKEEINEGLSIHQSN